MPATKVKLSKRDVERLKPPESGYELYYDSELDGLYLRVQSSGVKTYEIHKRTKAGVLKRKLGRHPEITPEQARQLALDLLARARLGELPEPVRKRKVEPAPEAKPQTLGEVWDRYSATKLLGRRPKSQTTYKSIWRCHLESMAAKRLADFSEGLVEDLHDQVTRENGPSAGNSACSLLRTVLSYAEKRNWITVNPARRFTRNKVEPVQNDVTEAQLVEVYKILGATGTAVDACLLFMFETGARIGETLAMRWTDLRALDDPEKAEWVKLRRTTKGDKTQRLPLAAEALAILESLPRAAPAALVFGLDEWGNAVRRRWYQVRQKVGIPEVRPHDLRHAYAMKCVRERVHPFVLRDLLGHSSVQQTERYGRTDRAQQRAAVKQVGSGSVLPFRRSA